MQFADLRLAEPILRSLIEENYVTATPIQAQAIPPALAGRDVLGCAQTGTGKTAAFALPILHRLTQGPADAQPQRGQKRPPRVLILCPTRELATQIHEGFAAYGRHLKVYSTVIFGGVSQHHQVRALVHGTDIIIATPGRLLDLINQGYCDLRHIQTLVLDEADRMLDMGFINDIRKITAIVPSKRQTLLFSATMPTEIKRLADQLMRDPVHVEVTPVGSVISKIDECVYMVEKPMKGALLAHLYDSLSMARTIVFTRTKHGADKVVKQLHKAGIRAEAIHGNKSQNARQRALDNFKSGKTPMLIATDIASRGIDVDMITHVVNYDLTHEPESYVHRVGRTARNGQSGVAVSFCDREERENLRAIEKLTRRPIRVIRDLPADLPKPEAGATHDRDDREESFDGDRDTRRERRPQPSKQNRPAHPHKTGGGVPRSSHPQQSQRSSHAPRPAAASHGGGQARHPASGGHGGQRPAAASSRPHAPQASRPQHPVSRGAGTGHAAAKPHPLGGKHRPTGGGRRAR